MMQRYPNFESHNSPVGTIPYFNPLPKGLGIASSGALVNNYCSSRENNGGNETELILSSNLSRAPNSYASSRPAAQSGGFMPTTLPFYRPIDKVNSNNPQGLASRGGSTGSCRFDIEAVRRFINRYPYLSQHFLQIVMVHNHSNHPCPACVICSLCPCFMMNNILEFMGVIPRSGLGINKFIGLESLVFGDHLPPPPFHGQLTVSMCPKEYIRALTSGRENKRCLCQALAHHVMNALKGPRVSSSSQVSWVGKPPQHELLLFKDSYKSSGSEIPTGGDDKYEATLDLSLHL